MHLVLDDDDYYGDLAGDFEEEGFLCGEDNIWIHNEFVCDGQRNPLTLTFN